MSKSLVGIKTAWGQQEEAFQSNVPLMNDKIKRTHTFNRNSMGTVFPFTTSEIGHQTGVPIGFNIKQEYQFCLIIFTYLLQIIIWLYLLNLVQENRLL